MNLRLAIPALHLLLPTCSLLAGCTSFTTPQPDTLARLRPMPLAGRLPGQFELELASSGLTGTFDAVCAVDAQSFRLQLFPDVGGKVLDLTVGRDAVTADFPGSRYEAKLPLDRAEPHLALVLALLFGELLAPVGAARVLGERNVDDGVVEVQLRPSLGSGTVTARLGADGAIEHYRVTLGWIEFEFLANGTLRGRGFSGRIAAAAR